MELAFAAPFGLVIGSFLNVVAYRLPRGESLVAPGSHCPGCDKVLIGRTGFRVTSYRLVDGKCPDCGTAIPGVWGDGHAAVGRSGIPRPVWLS